MFLSIQPKSPFSDSNPQEVVPFSHIFSVTSRLFSTTSNVLERQTVKGKKEARERERDRDRQRETERGE